MGGQRAKAKGGSWLPLSRRRSGHRRGGSCGRCSSLKLLPLITVGVAFEVSSAVGAGSIPHADLSVVYIKREDIFHSLHKYRG